MNFQPIFNSSFLSFIRSFYPLYTAEVKLHTLMSNTNFFLIWTIHSLEDDNLFRYGQWVVNSQKFCVVQFFFFLSLLRSYIERLLEHEINELNLKVWNKYSNHSRFWFYSRSDKKKFRYFYFQTQNFLQFHTRINCFQVTWAIYGDRYYPPTLIYISLFFCYPNFRV